MRRTYLLTILSSLLLTCTLYGCGGDGGSSSGGSGGGTSNVFAAASAGDLANRSFTFPNGVNQTLSARLGLPTGQAFSLQFGSFTGVTAPMTLESNGQTASGTVTLGSCTLRFEQSSFASGRGPQAGTQFLADPCEIETTQRFLRLTDPQSRETASSNPSVSQTRPNVAFVLSTDFSVGSYSTVDLATRTVTRDIRRGGVHSDALARAFGGRIYVVNRLNADNVQIIDPQQGFTTPANAQMSVGNGTNPHDIAFASATKAYVSRYGSEPSLLVLNPTTLQMTGSIALRSLVKSNDSDGVPEADHMLVNNGLLYVVLAHLDTRQGFTPVAPGEVAVIDTATDSIVRVIQLPCTNPFSELHFSPTLRRLLVSCVGDFGVNDGRIVAIDPLTQTVDPSIGITEAAMGGDITALAIVSSSKGFAVVSDANFMNLLVTFNPSTGQRLNTIFGPGRSFFHLALNSRNELYMAVADTRTPTPGLRIFDAVTDRDLTGGQPLSVGQLAPTWTVFLE
ncbi:MAG: hypothetical protein AB7N91_18630 [Candidatus Tectimicrobiota bacterium]